LAANYQLTGGTDRVTVTPLAILVTAVGSNKVYDGGYVAGVTLSGAGVFSGDSLSYADTSATFASKNAANGVIVSVAGITESGTGSGNYTVNSTTTTTGNITPLGITVTAAGTNKVYNGNVTAGVTLASAGVTGGDSVAFADTAATFATKNVASNQVVSVAGITDSGTGAGNYTLNNSTAATTASITPLGITVTAAAANKAYDGGFVAGVTLSSTGVLTGDSLNYFDTSATFASKNAANGVAVSVAGITESGTGSGNYTVNGTATAGANITPAVLNLSGTRAYDAQRDANAGIFGTAGTIATGVGVETVAVSGSGILAAKSAGVESASLGTLSLGNGTGLASNYQLTGGTDTVTVSKLAITVAGTANNKPYDGTTAATLSTLGSSGVISGDTVTFAAAPATFNSKDVTTANTVTIAGITGGGLDAGNYTLNNTTTTAGANITPAVLNLSGTRAYDALRDANAGIFGTAGTVATGVGVETVAVSGSGILAAKSAGLESASLGTLSLGNGTGLASNYQLTGGTDTVTVSKLAITVAGTANNKPYDGTTAATLSALGSGGVLAGDTVTFADTSATFNSKDVTTANTVTIAGITDGGLDAGNYTLNNTAATAGANIAPLAITVSATGINKVYDGGVTAAVALASTGVLPGDSVVFADSSATFANKNVANGLLVSVAGITEGGTGADNYTINTTATAAANITPAIVNLTGTRSYDALLEADAGIFGTAGTVATGVGAETLALSGSGALVNKNAGAQGLSSLGSLALGNGTGDSAGLASNYQLTGGSDMVTVTPLAITVTGIANNKTYDGTTSATLSGLGSGGVIAGDTVAFTAAGAAFANQNVADGKVVTIHGITDAGADAGNYRVNGSAVTTADVTPATLTETANPVSVAAGQMPNLNGSVSGFVPGDTRANATDGTLVWATNAPVPATPGSYAIDGSGLTAENYVLVQSPINAAALTVTTAPAATTFTAGVGGLFGMYLAPADIATPYGVGSANDFGNNTGNARRDNKTTDGNRHLSDFTGRLALTVIGAGVTMPPQAGP
jgi:hypothetical protein